MVCGTDAGREGELIFRLVYQYAGCSKPMERLWISSMEDAAIRDGFEHLRPGSDYDKLYDAAVCRAGADWLIGINATRLFSVLYGTTLNVGRVMSPTLALLVRREADIQAFTSSPFYVPEITCGGFTASGEKLPENPPVCLSSAGTEGQAAFSYPSALRISILPAGSADRHNAIWHTVPRKPPAAPAPVTGIEVSNCGKALRRHIAGGGPGRE